jgi:hypothetical protein
MNNGDEMLDGNDYNEPGKPISSDRNERPKDQGVRSTKPPHRKTVLVVLDGREGEQLHALQVLAVRRILTRLAKLRREARESSGEHDT